MNSIAKNLSIVLVMVSSLSIFCPDVYSETKYVREVVFETEPNKEPYYLSINIGEMWPTGNDNMETDIPFSNRFTVDDKGNIYILKWDERKIIKLDINGNIVSEIVFKAEDKLEWKLINGKKVFWAGVVAECRNDIFIGPDSSLYLSLEIRDHYLIDIIKFINNEKCYIDKGYNITFVKSEMLRYSGCKLNISPDNKMFVPVKGKSSTAEFDIYNQEGLLVKRTNYYTSTVDNKPVYLRFKKNRYEPDSTYFYEDRDSIVLNLDVSRSHYKGSLFCTNDNRIIIISDNDHHARYEKMKIDKNIYRRPVKLMQPKIQIVDINSGNINVLETKLECALEQYSEYSISDISINYMGDIYALVLYCNFPKEDSMAVEKIVLYKWHREEE